MLFSTKRAALALVACGTIGTAHGMVVGSAVTKLPFTKYHGLGNDFVLLDCRDSGSSLPRKTAVLQTSKRQECE